MYESGGRGASTRYEGVWTAAVRDETKKKNLTTGAGGVVVVWLKTRCFGIGEAPRGWYITIHVRAAGTHHIVLKSQYGRRQDIYTVAPLLNKYE